MYPHEKNSDPGDFSNRPYPPLPAAWGRWGAALDPFFFSKAGFFGKGRTDRRRSQTHTHTASSTPHPVRQRMTEGGTGSTRRALHGVGEAELPPSFLALRTRLPFHRLSGKPSPTTAHLSHTNKHTLQTTGRCPPRGDHGSQPSNRDVRNMGVHQLSGAAQT